MDIMLIFVSLIFVILVSLYLLGARRSKTVDNVFPKVFPLMETEDEAENKAD
jgi:hypothetical protein